MKRLLLSLLCLFFASCRQEARLLYDFEGGALQGWVVSGDSSLQPSSSRRANFNQHGTYFLGTGEVRNAHFDDSRKVAVRFPRFTIDSRYLVFRLGGGSDSDRCYFGLYRASDGVLLQKATGIDRETMITQVWDLKTWQQEEVYLQLVDDSEAPFGHINLDYVRLVDGS